MCWRLELQRKKSSMPGEGIQVDILRSMHMLYLLIHVHVHVHTVPTRQWWKVDTHCIQDESVPTYSLRFIEELPGTKTKQNEKNLRPWRQIPVGRQSLPKQITKEIHWSVQNQSQNQSQNQPQNQSAYQSWNQSPIRRQSIDQSHVNQSTNHTSLLFRILFFVLFMPDKTKRRIQKF